MPVSGLRGTNCAVERLWFRGFVRDHVLKGRIGQYDPEGPALAVDVYAACIMPSPLHHQIHHTGAVLRIRNEQEQQKNEDQRG